MSKPKIAVIVGSTRATRFADKPTEWIANIAKARGDFDVEVVDLRDYPMPFFDEATSSLWRRPRTRWRCAGRRRWPSSMVSS
jgi:NAD(P)H-dependent FMN reductase